jgi:cobalamin biosynthesis protein CobD/CbiB
VVLALGNEDDDPLGVDVARLDDLCLFICCRFASALVLGGSIAEFSKQFDNALFAHDSTATNSVENCAGQGFRE